LGAVAVRPEGGGSGRSLTDRLALALSRVTSSGGLIPEVDGLRTVAIGAVLLHHVVALYLESSRRLGPVRLPADWRLVVHRSWLVDVGYAGHFGVLLFFVVSGFILSIPFAGAALGGGRPVSLRSYFLRRLTRIEPPYVINMLACFALIWATNPGRVVFLPHLAASLAYLHGPVYGEGSWINGVAWSLEVEVQFYVLMPALALLFRVRESAARRALLISLIVASSLCSQLWIVPHGGPRLARMLPNYIQYFLTGCLLADLRVAAGGRAWRRSARWDMVGLAALAATILVLVRVPWLTAAVPALLLAVCAAALLGHAAGAILTRRWVVIVGGMCYTIYLYHLPVMRLLLPAALHGTSASLPVAVDVLVLGALLVAPVLAISAVLFVATEKPFMALSRRLAARRPRGAA
jgi:peptidoglycan/LPS O-acetylase OafA/YrhL